jgi:colicin import membrane protein
LNAKTTPHLEFAPPAQPGFRRAWVIAGIAHVLLFVALGLATSWKTQPQTLQAEAELWAATPQAAAPRLQEPPPEPEPEPKPEPKPVAKPTPPPPPEPDPVVERRDAEIALEKKKQQEKKKEAEKLKAEKEKAEKEKADAKRKEREKEREKEEKAKKEKLSKENKAKEDKERDKKKAAEKAKAQSEAEAARAEELRKENLKRMQGLAGASGGANATGSALQSAGPSASYAGRLIGRIKPNISYPGDVVGNPRTEIEVKVSPDGTILSRRIVQTSGNKAWDDAVLRAIDKTENLPKDTDGRVPPVIVLGFRPLD